LGCSFDRTVPEAPENVELEEYPNAAHGFGTTCADGIEGPSKRPRRQEDDEQQAQPAQKTKHEIPRIVMPPFPPPAIQFPFVPRFYAPPIAVGGLAVGAVAPYGAQGAEERKQKRQLKNRKSAERSRQRKNDLLKERTDLLKLSQEEKNKLREEEQELRSVNSVLERENAHLHDLLKAHGILVPS